MSEQNPVGHRLIINWDAKISHTKYLHKYGGLLSNKAILPKCSGCKDYYHLLLQIDLSDPTFTYLGLSPNNYLFVFTCLNCASYERVMYYTFDNQSQGIEVLQSYARKCIKEYRNPLDEYNISYRLLEDNEYPITKESLHNLGNKEGKHQMGGLPFWIQDEEHILCVNCKKEMPYIAMIDSELYIGKDGFREKGHMFGDEGILYIFYCRFCNMIATIGQCF